MSRLVLDSEFYCCKCGGRGLPIARKAGSEREAGHLKKLYCLKCKAEINHAECRPWTRYSKEDFELEFKYGNFDSEQNRIMPYGLFKDKLVKEGVLR